MGEIRVTAVVRDMTEPERAWEGLFVVDTGVVECVLPKRCWEAMGLSPVGERECILPGGSKRKMEFATGVVELMGGITGTSVFKADDDTEPILGRTILLSLGLDIDPDNQALTKLPAVRMPGIRLATDSQPTH